MAEIKIEGTLKVKTHTVIEEAIEKGIRYGYDRAYKYTEMPDQEQFIQEILSAVMLYIDEVVEF